MNKDNQSVTENDDVLDQDNSESEQSDEIVEESEASEQSDAESEQEKKRPVNGFKKRINRLNSKLSVAQQEADYWKQRYLSGAKDGQEKEVEKPPVKPQKGDFDSDDAYLEALADFKVEERLRESQSKAAAAQSQSTLQERAKQYDRKAAEFSATQPDWDEVMDEVADIPVSKAIRDLILESDNGPQLAYALAQNREEYERINALSPLAAARELGRIEAGLTKGKTTTKAPPPMPRVGSQGAARAKSIYDPDISLAEFERLEQKRKGK